RPLDRQERPHRRRPLAQRLGRHPQAAVMETATMTKNLFVPAALALSLAAACGNSNPAAPVPGALIDRMGRAAVNTAVTNPFDLVAGSTVDTTKNAYNSNKDPSTWVTAFAP